MYVPRVFKLRRTASNPAFASQSELRAIVSAVSNMAAFIINAIAPNFVWKVSKLEATRGRRAVCLHYDFLQTVDFPRAHKGYIFSISLSAVQCAYSPVTSQNGGFNLTQTR